MDINQIKSEVIPHLKELLFPKKLIDELIWYTDNEGIQEKVNKDLNPYDIGYMPNTKIDISSEFVLKKAKEYFELSDFTTVQLEYIFKALDKYFELFKNIPLKNLFALSSSEVHKTNEIINDVTVRQKEIIENYTNLKKQLLGLKTKKLTVDQIALFYFYKGIQITRANGVSKIKPFGFKSGERLYQRYNYFSSSINRINPPYPNSHTKFKNKIKLFESVVNMLPISKRKRAQSELDTLKSKFSDTFN